jgi:hypothetical protein
MDWRRASEDERAVENVRRWLRNLPTLEELEEADRKADEAAADRAQCEAADAIYRHSGPVKLTVERLPMNSDTRLTRHLHNAGRHAKCLECRASLYTPNYGPIPRSFWCRECHRQFERKRTAADGVLMDYYGQTLEDVASKN